MGLCFGSVWTVTRAMIIKYTPHHSLNQSFTYFVLMERFATFISPITWGLIIMYAPSSGSLNYRAAIFSMAIFVLIGLWIVKKLPKDIGIKEVL